MLFNYVLIISGNVIFNYRFILITIYYRTAYYLLPLGITEEFLYLMLDAD